MKILNPNYTPALGAEGQAAADDLAAYFAANPDKRAVTFDQVRQRLGRTAEQLPNGAIAQAAQNLGYEVEE